MSPIFALLLCLLCLPLTTEAGSAAIPTDIAIIILAAIAGVYFFVTVVLVLLVCWCCCGRDRSKCAKVLPVNNRTRKNSYSTNRQSTELDSLSSKRTSATDLSSCTETEGGIITRAVSQEYMGKDGETRTYVTTRTASAVIVEKPSPFISRKPVEPLPYRSSPLLGRRVAWSSPEKTDATASSDLDKARDSRVSPVPRDQTGKVSPLISDQKPLPELPQSTVSGAGAGIGSTPSGATESTQSREESHTIKNKHAEDIDDIFAPFIAPKMDTNLSLGLQSHEEEAQVVPVSKKPAARTDSTMPLLLEDDDDSPEPSVGSHIAAAAFETTETNATSPALFEEQKQAAQKKPAVRTDPLLGDSSPKNSRKSESPDIESEQTNTPALNSSPPVTLEERKQSKKPAVRTNSTQPLLEDSSPENSRKSESPDIETNTTALNSSPAVTFNERKQEAKQRRKRSAVRTSSTKPLLENGTSETSEVDAPLDQPTRRKKQAWSSTSKLPPLDTARPRPSRVSAQDRLRMYSRGNGNAKKPPKPVRGSADGGTGMEQPEISGDSGRVDVKTRVMEIEERKASQESDGSLTIL